MPGRAMEQRSHARGFSLLELMVVLTLIAILALLAAPSMAGWMRNQRIRGTTEALLSGLQTAREEAIRRNRPASFWLVTNLTDGCAPSSASGTWVVSLNAPDGACNAAPSATDDPLLVASQAAQAQGGVDVQAFDKDNSVASEVRFDGYGRIAATGLGGGSPIARIEVRDPADAANDDATTHTYRSLRVQIQGTGAIRLCDPRITTTGDTRAC